MKKEEIRKEFKLVASIKLLNKLKSLKYLKSADKILVSDLGKFLVLICSSSESANPSFSSPCNFLKSSYLNTQTHFKKSIKDFGGLVIGFRNRKK